MSLKLALIGLDTSHVRLFSDLLHDSTHPFHIPGARVTAAFPGGSPDDPVSREEVQRYTRELTEKYGTPMLDSPEEAVKQCDAVLLTSRDGRTHPELFSRIAGLGKPVFIDKPLALSSREAIEIIDTAREQNCPIMSSSMLRFAQGIREMMEDESGGAIFGTDAHGPGYLDSFQPGLFLYGIHTVEMIYTVLGRGCRSVAARSDADDDIVVAEWNDGRIGTVRTNRRGSNNFGLLVHRPGISQYINVRTHPKPMSASLLEAIIAFFRSGETAVPLEETLEIIRFIEAANESAETGNTIKLQE